MTPYIALTFVLLILFVVNMYVGRRWVRLYVDRYHKLPERWLSVRDEDPEIERWRRFRIATTVGVFIGLGLLLYTTLAR